MCDQATALGAEFADLQAAAELIEEGALRAERHAQGRLTPRILLACTGKKSVLASLTLFHMDGGMSKAAAETKALCDDEYVGYIARLTEARHAAQLARIEYEATRKKVDLVRTYESSRRCVLRRFACGVWESTPCIAMRL